MATSDEIRQIQPEDDEILEEWVRGPDADMVRGVDVTRMDEPEWPFQVFVAAMEFLREDPLESEFRAALRRSLAAVPGVTGVEEEDREVWTVDGNPSAEALTRAAAATIDAYADRLQVHYDNLG